MTTPTAKEALAALIEDPGPRSIAGTAYDTAWLARVRIGGEPAFPAALEWLLTHQHADGSWGGRALYNHDRLVSTVAAVLALDDARGTRRIDDVPSRIERAMSAIWRASAHLREDAYDLIGFELVFPALLDLGRQRGLPLPYDAFDGVLAQREKKLASLPSEALYSRRIPALFNAECLGDGLDVARARPLQDSDGSLAGSPSATAALFMRDPENTAAAGYLRFVAESWAGTAPAVQPIDVFESAWMLFHAGEADPSLLRTPSASPHLQRLRNVMERSGGVSYSSTTDSVDLDCTSMAYRVLVGAGIEVDPKVLMQFEREEHFVCFLFERNPSISAHVHLLEALRAAPAFDGRERALAKVLTFLRRVRTQHAFWFDKWHASPYYTTARALIGLRADPDLAAPAAAWIRGTQYRDGSWGHYAGRGTAEETAYCLLALAAHARCGGAGLDGSFERGAAYLAGSPEYRERDYAPLWIGKSLYAPTAVVHSAVLAALAIAESS